MKITLYELFVQTAIDFVLSGITCDIHYIIHHFYLNGNNSISFWTTWEVELTITQRKIRGSWAIIVKYGTSHP